MVESTWESRERRVLEAVARGEQMKLNGDLPPEWTTSDVADLISDWTGIPSSEVTHALIALYNAGYIDGVNAPSFGGDSFLDPSLTERGRREIGLWPSVEGTDAVGVTDSVRIGVERALPPLAPIVQVWGNDATVFIGDNRGAQRVDRTVDGSELGRIEELVGRIYDALQSGVIDAELDEGDSVDVQRYTDVVNDEVKTRRPSVPIILTALGILAGLLLDVAGNGMYDLIVAAIQRLS